MKLLLINIPQKVEPRYGNSINEKDSIKISELIERKNCDVEEIKSFVDCMYDNVPGSTVIYFDEFIKITKEITSELYVSIFDCLYSCIPLVKNYIILRNNYI